MSKEPEFALTEADAAELAAVTTELEPLKTELEGLAKTVAALEGERNSIRSAAQSREVKEKMTEFTVGLSPNDYHEALGEIASGRGLLSPVERARVKAIAEELSQLGYKQIEQKIAGLEARSKEIAGRPAKRREEWQRLAPLQQLTDLAAAHYSEFAKALCEIEATMQELAKKYSDAYPAFALGKSAENRAHVLAQEMKVTAHHIHSGTGHRESQPSIIRDVLERVLSRQQGQQLEPGPYERLQRRIELLQGPVVRSAPE